MKFFFFRNDIQFVSIRKDLSFEVEHNTLHTAEKPRRGFEVYDNTTALHNIKWIKINLISFAFSTHRYIHKNRGKGLIIIANSFSGRKSVAKGEKEGK